MDNQKDLEQLKEFQRLLLDPLARDIGADASLEQRYAHELHKNKLFDMASDLAYMYPKDAHDLWKQHMPEEFEPPPLLRQAYDRLPDETKQSPEGALQAAMDQEARSSNLHKILFRAIERIEEKYPAAAKTSTGHIAGDSQGVFYVEILNVFKERDFPVQATEKQMPSLEEALALTKLLERHNDPAQRAELERFADEYVRQALAANESAQEQMSFDFPNTLQSEPEQRSSFQTVAELLEHVEALAKDSQAVQIPGRDAMLYVDGDTNTLTLAALTEAAAAELGSEMGTAGDETEYVGNRIVFRANAFENAAAALAKLKLEDKDLNAMRSVVRQMTNKRIPDISELALQRARELRQARLIELARLAQKEAALENEVQEKQSSAPALDRALLTKESKAAKALPPNVERTYLRIEDKKGDRFYLNNRLDTIAFVDKGGKLETKGDNEHTALDMVSIADARGWESIKVAGTEAFRRQVWLEASARGITVRGYKPNEIDKALLAKRTAELAKDGPNSIEHVNERSKGEPTKAAAKESEASAPTPPQQQARTETAAPAATDIKPNDLSGILLEHGAAPFEFNKDNNTNYYVKYRDQLGNERITWGLDLKRAIEESEAKIGDRVTLENQGRKAVEVDQKVKDDEGKVVGTKRITTHRNSWNIEVARDFLQMPAQDFAAKHPSQVNAAILNAFTRKALAEHPKFENMSDNDKERLRTGVEKKIAEAIEDGKNIPALKVVTRSRPAEYTPEVERTASRSR